MADTLPDVTLPAKTPVDLYAATGITVGTQVNVQNLTSGDVRVHVGATEPTLGVSGSGLLVPGQSGENTQGDSGLWAWSITGGAVQVTEVV
ncbi:MAG: hypothetical protein Tp118SUR00d2C21406351_40 [Prokaryotic dsDNA virus sp.]|nr:MAG: hypothetical protein Tp118SUR00d2C21406351_40 [Prokaryotic dsDNA virus sp.]|tara:strand:- start:27097 stop:27369 length:273 start_codon:yes stop_codon:yes gene_type:complete